MTEPEKRAIGPMDPSLKLGRRIQVARMELGLSQVEIAAALNMAQTAVSEIETGVTKDIRISTARRFADFFGVSVGYLLDPSQPEDFSGFLLELARRNTAAERDATSQSEWHWGRFQSDQAMYYRGVAAGLKMAQTHQIAVTWERRAADGEGSPEGPGVAV